MKFSFRPMILSAMAFGLAVSALAQEAPIQSTIQSQLDAFKAEDFARAFTYASPTIKGIFGSPENFGRMVQQGYPMVWQPGAVKMLGQRAEAGRIWQRVLVTDAAGRSFLLDYAMIETPGGWQIDGVQLIRQPQPTA